MTYQSIIFHTVWYVVDMGNTKCCKKLVNKNYIYAHCAGHLYVDL